MNDQELEVKYYIKDLKKLEQRVIKLGAALSHMRVHEINLRFDRDDLSLTRSGYALRLRSDEQVRLTYKGASSLRDGVHQRQEIEFVVSDFKAAKDFLLALGYHVYLIYEKYRTTYTFDGVEITLDELPYGNFVELECEDPGKIHDVSMMLGLNWDTRIFASYTVLFDQLRKKMGLDIRDLVFENFQQISIGVRDLGVIPADTTSII